jgi:hypothetical protein
VNTVISKGRLQRRAVVRVIQKIQHAAPGVVLFLEGLRAFSEGAHGWHLALAVAELATAGAVAIALLVAIRSLVADLAARRAPHLHFGIDWADIFLGAMLFTEVAAKYPQSHRLWRPATLLGIVMIVLGVYGGKIAKSKAERRSAALSV